MDSWLIPYEGLRKKGFELTGNRELIRINMVVAASATETRASAPIPYPFLLLCMTTDMTARADVSYTSRIGISENEALAIASDPTFRDIWSNRSSMEVHRIGLDYSLYLIGRIIDEPLIRLKVELTSDAGAARAINVTFTIEELERVTSRKG